LGDVHERAAPRLRFYRYTAVPPDRHWLEDAVAKPIAEEEYALVVSVVMLRNTLFRY